ncbi:MAG: nicotinate-nucleotide--dimethylbenzimidazole phosphoribosyltransferase [Actinomycetota bacterium]
MPALRDLLDDLPAADDAARSAVATRATEVLRPVGALARLDAVAAWAAGWQRTVTPAVERPAALVFAADHGVAAAGVSAYPPDVTAAMVQAFDRGVATMTVFARHVGAAVSVVDVGVGRPTADLRHEPALDAGRFDATVDAAAAAVDALDTDLLVLGELGIGNTTAASALSAVLLGGDPASWVGRGTGIDDDGLARKASAVADAVARVDLLEAAVRRDPIEMLRHVGGAELVGMAAAIVAARRRGLPVVLDGFICTAAALPLELAVPGALDHCVVGHRSAEPGHRRLLDRLGAAPLLDLDLRLGEGSGAMAAVPLIRLACAGVVEVETFTEFFGSSSEGG